MNGLISWARMVGSGMSEEEAFFSLSDAEKLSAFMQLREANRNIRNGARREMVRLLSPDRLAEFAELWNLYGTKMSHAERYFLLSICYSPVEVHVEACRQWRDRLDLA